MASERNIEQQKVAGFCRRVFPARHLQTASSYRRLAHQPPGLARRALLVRCVIAPAIMGPITTDIIDCDRDDDDVAIETERFVLEAEIASRESEHVIIANELRWLRKRLVQVEARLRRSDKRPTVCSDD